MAQLGFGLNINETAEKFGYDQYQTKLGETLEAVAADNWNFNPLSSIGTYYDLQSARSQARETNQVPLLKENLNKEYADIGLFFKDDEYQSVVDIMVQEKKEERERQSIIARGPKGFAVGAAKFATGLSVSLFDPINIAASFIPVFGQARFAGLVARQGFSKARLAKGVTEGAVGAAVVEPIVYGVAKTVQADYGLADSFLNITFGSILGGGLHVGAGKLKDLNTSRKFKQKIKSARKNLDIKSDVDPEVNLYKEYYPENSKIMRDLEKTNPETRKLLLEKPVDTSPIVSADPILRKSTDSVSTSQTRVKSDSTTDQIELNTVEKNVVNKNSSDMDIDINNLQTRLEILRNNQKDSALKFDEDEVDVKEASEELNELNTKSKDLDDAIKDAINCVNGR